jgi:hypothetical protein
MAQSCKSQSLTLCLGGVAFGPKITASSQLLVLNTARRDISKIEAMKVNVDLSSRSDHVRDH